MQREVNHLVESNSPTIAQTDLTNAQGDARGFRDAGFWAEAAQEDPRSLAAVEEAF